MKSKLYKCRKSIVLAMKLLLYALLMGIFFLILSIHNPQMLVPSRTAAVTAVSFVVGGLLLTNIYGRYDIGQRKSKPIIYSMTLSVLFTDLFTFIMLVIMNTNDANNKEFLEEDLLLLLVVFFLQVFCIIIFTYGGHALYFSFVKPERCLIITDSKDSLHDLKRGINKYKKQYQVEQVILYNDPLIWEKILEVDTVFLNNVPGSRRTEVVEYCYQKMKNVYYNPEIVDVVNINSRHVILDDVSMIAAEVRELSVEQKLVKRSLDFVVALIGLIITSPILILCALAIKICDGGKVLFCQGRVTIDGEVFTIYKFRTMVEDADKHLVTDHDDRITPVGKFLRKYRLDELPQLFNILKGDMSLVGPRPEMTEYVYAYSESLPEFQYRHRVKAGLTGFAQIMGKYNTTSKDKLILDLMYIENFSLWNDIKIIFQTILVLFKASDSTEAFSEEDERHQHEENV
ncbi:sugar transferase [Hominifimenecus sp. rT4P-3]|uniref:sugar transferase n=1 Tax=Hominifimenecus sp. rT4P-3 TaxID=3242979 RepID=UPI003DA2142B